MLYRLLCLLALCAAVRPTTFAAQLADGDHSSAQVGASALDAAIRTEPHAASSSESVIYSAPETAPPLGNEWVSIPLGGFAKEIVIELYGSTRTAAPGGMVVIRYSVMSYEDADEYIRLTLGLPAGWMLLDKDIDGREFLLEAWESLDGEIRVAIPKEVQRGEQYRIDVRGTARGESGSLGVYSQAQIVRRGGLRPGAVGLTGTATAFATSGIAGAPDYGGVIDLAGRLSERSTVSFGYRHGRRENNVSNYRIAQEETRWTGSLRRGTWSLQFGNQISVTGNVLTGPSVRGQGANLRRTEGRIVGDVTVAEPISLYGSPGGHLVRGNVGLRLTRGRIGLAFSDFARPGGGTATFPSYLKTSDPEEFERLEREWRALQKASSNRVLGTGVDADLLLAKVHRVGLRTGYLWLTNVAGDRVEGPSAEAHYALNHPLVNVNARWRQMPRSLLGVYLPGNETSIDANLKIVGNWRLAGRAYQTLNRTMGRSYHSNGEGASLGARYAKQDWRVEVRGNYRTWSYGEEPTKARTVNLSFGIPVGPLSLSGHAERGEQQRASLNQPAASYRTDLRWIGKFGTLSWSASYYDVLNSAARLRSDVLVALKIRDWEWAGGAWVTRGWTFGGEPGAWMQLGIPLANDLQLTVGVEHAPLDWGGQPAWLGAFGIRKKLVLPVPFLHYPRPAVAAAESRETADAKSFEDDWQER